MKLHGKFDDYKKNRAKLEKERRIRLKEALAKLSVAKRNQVIEEQRVKNRKGVQKFRKLQAQRKLTDDISRDTQNKAQGTADTNQSQSLPLQCNDQVDVTTLIAKDSNEPQSKLEVVPSNNESLTEKHQEQDIRKEEVQTSSTSLNQPDPTTSTKTCDCQLTVITSTCDKERNEPLVSKSIDFPHSYKTQSALSKAVAKTRKTLPSSPSKRKAVLARLLRSFSEEDQRDIIGNTKSKGKGIKTNKGLSSTLVKDIRLFYERDDISRISPNVKDLRKFENPDTGEMEPKQIRYLNYKLSEVYLQFLDDVKG